MQKKPRVDVLLRKKFGKEVVDKLMPTIKKMKKKGATTAQIQRTVYTFLIRESRKQLTTLEKGKRRIGLHPPKQVIDVYPAK